MTDKNVALEASDVLDLTSLDSKWIPQNKDAATTQDRAEMLKANGDYQKFSSVFNIMTAITVPYAWNNDTGLGAAFGSGASSLLGAVRNGYLITGIRIETVYNLFPAITFTCHNHANNAHASGLPVYEIPADMKAILTGAYGAYDFAGKAGGDCDVVRGTYEIAVEHIDAEGSDGNHWVGTNVKGLETLSCDFIGVISSPLTISGWTVREAGDADSNEEFDATRVTAERIVGRYVAP